MTLRFDEPSLTTFPFLKLKNGSFPSGRLLHIVLLDCKKQKSSTMYTAKKKQCCIIFIWLQINHLVVDILCAVVNYTKKAYGRLAHFLLNILMQKKQRHLCIDVSWKKTETSMYWLHIYELFQKSTELYPAAFTTLTNELFMDRNPKQ